MPIDYHALLTVGLPIIDRWFEYSDGGTRSLYIIGPPEALIQQHSPCMWHARNKSGSRQIEMDSGTSVQDIVEAQWQWAVAQDESRTRLVVVCTPPSSRELTKGLPRGPRSNSVAGFPSACQSLLLASLLDCWNAIVFVLVDDAELQHQTTRAFARSLGSTALKTIPRPPADGLRLKTQLASGSARFVDSHTTLTWSTSSSPLFPAWCWTRPVASQGPDVEPSDESRAAILALSDNARGPSDGEVFFMRSLTGGVADAIAASPDEMDRLMEVYQGCGVRNEDDRLIPIEVALRSGHWTPTGVDPEHSIYEPLSRSKGFPIKTLGEICDQIDLLDKSTVGIAPPALNGSDNRDLLESPEWLPDKVIRFRGSDARFLGLVLRDRNVWHDIRCRGYGSYDRPRITAQMIQQSKIPWPGEDERKRLLDEINKFRSAVAESAEDVACLQSAIDELKERGGGEFSPWRLADDVECITGPLRTIQERFRTFLPMERPWPAPIAIVRRKTDNELNQIIRLRHLFHAAETIIRYDALVLVSILNKVAPRQLVEIVGECKNLKTRGHATFGDWRGIQRSAAKRLWETPIENVPDEYRRVLQSIQALDEDAIESSSKVIIDARNKDQHGSPALSESQAHSEADPLKDHLDKLQKALAFHTDYPPIYIERIHRTRVKIEVDIQELVGDSSRLPRQRTQRSADSPVGNARAEEVYLDLGNYESVHSLWPWVLFRGNENPDRKDMWLFNKVCTKSKAVEYLAVDGPGTPLQLDEPLASVRRSLFGD